MASKENRRSSRELSEKSEVGEVEADRVVNAHMQERKVTLLPSSHGGPGSFAMRLSTFVWLPD
jgi:hypothetical protein